MQSCLFGSNCNFGYPPLRDSICVICLEDYINLGKIAVVRKRKLPPRLLESTLGPDPFDSYLRNELKQGTTCVVAGGSEIGGHRLQLQVEVESAAASSLYGHRL